MIRIMKNILALFYCFLVFSGCQQAGSDGGNRVFDVLIDGKPIQTLDLSTPNPECPGLYRRYIEIPDNCIASKNAVTVKFQAKNGSTAGGVFDVRIIK
jgi:hypothetical protein